VVGFDVDVSGDDVWSRTVVAADHLRMPFSIPKVQILAWREDDDRSRADGVDDRE
jgi:hypothetical protein